MLLALDIGNTQLYGGVFDQDRLVFRFRRTSKVLGSSDEYGLFLRTVLRENNIDPALIKHVVMGSVVPEMNYSLASACIKYLDCQPLILQAGVKTGLKIKYPNPLEIGADLIADAIAASHLYPKQNIMVINFGTATTLTVVNAKREFLGGAIVPGLKLEVEALQRGTAKLPTVEIAKPKQVIGRSTIECIQSGIYYGAIGLVKEIVNQVRSQYFENEELLVVGTGGLAHLFESAGCFDHLERDLVLVGLYLVFLMNQD